MKKTVRKIPIVFLFLSCFPSFVTEETKKEIKQDALLLKWIDVIGILDQNYPNYITIQVGEQKDTICRAHNIANLETQGEVIIIDFFGTPKRYNEPITIPEEMLGYKIEIDTTLCKESGK